MTQTVTHPQKNLVHAVICQVIRLYLTESTDLFIQYVLSISSFPSIVPENILLKL